MPDESDKLAMLSNPEQRAYALLFDQHLSAREVSRILKAEGQDWGLTRVLNFKKHAFELLVKAEREEHLSELVLDSFERTKVEFEDLLSKIKLVVQRFDDQNQPFEMLMALREVKDCIGMALKVQGRYNEGIQAVHAKTINIINSPEFMNTFKQFQSRQFEDMKAELVDGRIVFSTPSPELIDDFMRWKDSAHPPLPANALVSPKPIEELMDFAAQREAAFTVVEAEVVEKKGSDVNAGIKPDVKPADAH